MKPRSLMFTLFGDYIRYFGGEIWIGSLIKLMSNFGISESSVRGATLRMVQQDLLTVRRVGHNSYYSLSKKGQRRIADGVKRVYTMENKKWDGYWRVVSYSIPEEKRDIRNQIRKELIWTGFGLIANGILISPNPLEQQVLEMREMYDLEDHIILFTSSNILTHDNQDLIDKGWDFKQLEQEYDQFIEKYTLKYEELKAATWNESLTDQECFVERTLLVHEYRKFLFKDPGFPSDLLPPNWSGDKARDLFWKIHQLISLQAVRYFDSVFKQAPDREEVHKDIEAAVNPFSNLYFSKP